MKVNHNQATVDSTLELIEESELAFVAGGELAAVLAGYRSSYGALDPTGEHLARWVEQDKY